MAECFCGCGRKVRLLDRNLSSQGRYTLELIDRLEVAQGKLERDDPIAEGWDEAKNERAIALLPKYIEQGHAFSDLFRRAVHHEPLPSPGTANALRREWGAWRKSADGLANLFSLPVDEMVTAFHAYFGEAPTVETVAEPQASLDGIEVGPWHSEPEYQQVAYIAEAGDPPRHGLFVFVNIRLVELQGNQSAIEEEQDIMTEVMESDLDLEHQIDAANNHPLDEDRIKAGAAAAFNNPANWSWKRDNPNALPDDQFVCMELDPLSGRVLFSDD
ncbi:MAG TPA: hypothetical protein VND98_06150 [Solirubrobacterales bacterium]|nr:hypothetical protein [Solirubrobacterales bacterium]